MRHLIGAALDRLDHRRHADDLLTPDTRILTFDPDAASVLVDDAPHLRLAFRTAAEVGPDPDAAVVLLGERQGVRWAARAAPQPDGSGTSRFEAVRAAASSLPAQEAGLVVYGAGILAWHRRARFCGACGATTRSTHGGHQRVCDACGAVQFPRTDPAVITLPRRHAGRAPGRSGGPGPGRGAGPAGSETDSCLLINQPRWPEDRFAAVAGFVEPGETLEQAVAREVAEEVGLELTGIEYLGSQPWPFPHSLMIAFRAIAADGELRLGPEVRKARWFTRPELRAAVHAGEITLPTQFSISRSLVDDWLAGGPD